MRALPALHEVNIPSGIRIIANHALLACRNLSSVFLPDGVEEIGEHAFYHCQQMLSVRFPQSLRKIGDLAFFSCESLSNIVLPDGVEEIGHMAFAFCRSLMHIHLPDRLTCLEHSLLRSCEKLQHITIPENVTSIQHEIFCCCSALSQITFHEHQFYELYNVLSGSSKPFLHCIAPIDQFPQRAQIRLAIGFALNEDTYPPEIAQSYLSYLRENTFALHRAACIYPQLLRIMCRERMISVEHIPVFLKQASYFDNVEITALLLGYQHALQPEIPDALEWDID